MEKFKTKYKKPIGVFVFVAIAFWYLQTHPDVWSFIVNVFYLFIAIIWWLKDWLLILLGVFIFIFSLLFGLKKWHDNEHRWHKKDEHIFEE